jgi:hypothetical protein
MPLFEKDAADAGSKGVGVLSDKFGNVYANLGEAA